MEDEIKEILQKIKNVANRETASRNALMEMQDKDYQLLLDYITNLQEYYNDNVNKYEELIVKYSDLQEELKITQEKWEKDKQFSKCRTMEMLDYKSRNEKAIEYIKETSFFNKSHYDFKNDLLNILQGSDNNE